MFPTTSMTCQSCSPRLIVRTTLVTSHISSALRLFKILVFDSTGIASKTSAASSAADLLPSRRSGCTNDLGLRVSSTHFMSLGLWGMLSPQPQSPSSAHSRLTLSARLRARRMRRSRGTQKHGRAGESPPISWPGAVRRQARHPLEVMEQHLSHVHLSLPLQQKSSNVRIPQSNAFRKSTMRRSQSSCPEFAASIASAAIATALARLLPDAISASARLTSASSQDALNIAASSGEKHLSILKSGGKTLGSVRNAKSSALVFAFLALIFPDRKPPDLQGVRQGFQISASFLVPPHYQRNPLLHSRARHLRGRESPQTRSRLSISTRTELHVNRGPMVREPLDKTHMPDLMDRVQERLRHQYAVNSCTLLHCRCKKGIFPQVSRQHQIASARDRRDKRLKHIPEERPPRQLSLTRLCFALLARVATPAAPTADAWRKEPMCVLTCSKVSP
ncbi:unnamed protein product [Closterium sp. Yama58-4]|nr:unnamed protein product [Closterium sp. Yama58-4]